MKILLLITTLIGANYLFGQTKPNLDKADDAVVLIMIYDYKGEYQGHGSGFVIDSLGTIATNYHVVEGSYSMKVQFDNNGTKQIFDVDKILSGDKNKDLATISIKKESGKKFSYLKSSKTAPNKGDDCWAIGTPADPQYMNTITEGIVSNIYPNGIQDWTGRMLQVSAPYTHGSSGGALINKNGEAIGVTCGGQPDEDGARANINWAISIDELKNLPSINKERLIDPNSIPCQLSFYTNSPYSGSVYLYVDGIYIGYFTKYFPNTAPQCGAEGTITRNLYAGVHSYTVYYASTGQYYYGTITLTPGQCQIFGVAGPSAQSYYNPYASLFSNRKVFDDKNEFNWAVYSGYTASLYVGDAYVPKIPIPVMVERSFNENKFAIRSKIEFFKGKQETQDYYTSFEPTTSTRKSSYFASITDLKLIWNRKYRFNFWTGPTLGFTKFENYLSYYTSDYNFNTGQYENILVEESENLSGISYGLRFGFDMYATKRFYLSSDFGYMKYRGLNQAGADINIMIGYRFRSF
jgi:hypothetical protein